MLNNALVKNGTCLELVAHQFLSVYKDMYN